MASSPTTAAEPDPKRPKIEVKQSDKAEVRDKGWDILGQYDYHIYWGPDPDKPDGDPASEGLDADAFVGYLKHVRDSKGFDINIPRYHPMYGFFLILPPNHSPKDEEDAPDFVKYPSYEIYCRLANFFAPLAVDFHNEKTDAKLEYVSFVKANHLKSWGLYYFITLIAQDMRTKSFKKCQTRVFQHYARNPSKILYTVESFLIAGDVDKPENPFPKLAIPPGYNLIHEEKAFKDFSLPT